MSDAPINAYDLATFLDKDDFKVDWSRRRDRIDYSLIFLGSLLAFTVIGLLSSVYVNKTIDPNLSYILSGFVWADLGAFIAILGSYIFGPTWDANNFRKNTAEIIKSVTSANGAIADISKMAPSKATATTTLSVESDGEGEIESTPVKLSEPTGKSEK